MGNSASDLRHRSHLGPLRLQRNDGFLQPAGRSFPKGTTLPGCSPRPAPNPRLDPLRGPLLLAVGPFPGDSAPCRKVDSGWTDRSRGVRVGWVAYIGIVLRDHRDSEAQVLPTSSERSLRLVSVRFCSCDAGDACFIPRNDLPREHCGSHARNHDRPLRLSPLSANGLGRLAMVVRCFGGRRNGHQSLPFCSMGLSSAVGSSHSTSFGSIRLQKQSHI